MTTAPRDGAPRDGAGRDPGGVGRWTVGEAMLGWLVAFVVANVGAAVILGSTGYLGEDADDPPLTLVALAQLPLWGALLAVAVWLARRRGRGDLRDDVGLRFQRRDGWAVFAGLATQLIVVPLLYLPLTSVIDRDEIEAPARALTDRAEGLGIALLAVMVVLCAPVVEEIFYRGILLRAFQTRMPGWAAVGASALCFGAAHFQLIQLPALVAFGVVAGALAQRTGRLGASILAHAAFNLVTVVVLVLDR